jgi:hypothetical protein
MCWRHCWNLENLVVISSWRAIICFLYAFSIEPSLFCVYWELLLATGILLAYRPNKFSFSTNSQVCALRDNNCLHLRVASECTTEWGSKQTTKFCTSWWRLRVQTNTLFWSQCLLSSCPVGMRRLWKTLNLEGLDLGPSVPPSSKHTLGYSSFSPCVGEGCRS